MITLETCKTLGDLLDAALHDGLATPRSFVADIEQALEDAADDAESDLDTSATRAALAKVEGRLQDEHDARLALVEIAAEGNGEWRKARQAAFVDLLCKLPRVPGITMARHIESVRTAAREAFEAKRLPSYEAWVLGLSEDGGPPTGGHPS